jgi:hypothetical protein
VKKFLPNAEVENLFVCSQGRAPEQYLNSVEFSPYLHTLLKIQFSIILLCSQSSHRWYVLFIFSSPDLYAISLPPALFLRDINLTNLITLTLFHEKCKLWNYSVSNSFQFISFFWGSNTVLSTLFTNILSLLYAFNIIIVWHNWFFIVLLCWYKINYSNDTVHHEYNSKFLSTPRYFTLKQNERYV